MRKTKSGDDSETLSKLLGPTVVAREERRVQRDVLRDAIVAGLDDGPTTTMLRSERAVETLETSAAAIDREIEAVEAATNDLLVQMSTENETRVEEERTKKKKRDDAKLRKQVAAKRLAGLKEKRLKIERELEKALEVAKVERREHEKEETKKKKDVNAAAVPKKSKVVVQDDFDFDAELDAVQKRTTTDNLLGGGTNGTEETERE